MIACLICEGRRLVSRRYGQGQIACMPSNGARLNAYYMCSSVQRKIQLRLNLFTQYRERYILYIGFDYNNMSAKNYKDLQLDGDKTINH